MLVQTAYLLIIGTHRKGGPHSETAVTRNGLVVENGRKLGIRFQLRFLMNTQIMMETCKKNFNTASK